MISYYASDAFIQKNERTFDNEKIIVTDKEIDLRLFGDCPHLLREGCSSLWYDYLKKPKPHGNFINKQYIRWLKRKHQRLLKSEVGSTSGLFVVLHLMGLCTGWFLAGAYCLTTLYFYFSGSLLSFWEEITFPVGMVGFCYLLAQIGKFGASYYDDECGLIFDRATGKVTRVIPDGSITHTYDFKDFKGELDTFINTGGQKERTAFVIHKKTHKCVLLGQGLVRGAIAWSYLVRFMDITKPLPDIPEHETTRHLDPVTKAHDEKTGRDPNFWAKQARKEVRKLELESLKKAEVWVEERKQLLNEKGIHDLTFLNNLLSGDFSA